MTQYGFFFDMNRCYACQACSGLQGLERHRTRRREMDDGVVSGSAGRSQRAPELAGFPLRPLRGPLHA